jgi:uncharacterized membrane protein
MPAVKRPRLPFLDWMRGLAGLIMLQGHTFHSFARSDLRNGGPYVYSQFFGGVAPAVFLFLTGITFAFSMERADRSGLGAKHQLINALKRARYLFVIAFLFRLQLWLFGGAGSPWTDLLKVDILNCMGATMLLIAPVALLTKEHRIRAAAIAGVVIAAASPLISLAPWDWMPWAVRNYIVPSYSFFSLFPWASFLVFGIAAGSILKSVTADQMNRLMQWSTIAGFLLAFGGQYFSNIPYDVYPKSEFWLNSPWLIIIKLGVVLMVAGVAFLWTEHVIHEKWSWVKQVGTTSLLIYWVHIELVYGQWFGFWKNNLNNYQCAIFAAVLIAAMLALSVARTKWKSLPIAQWVPIPHSMSPRRVSGD